jgi:hypothetical protein
LGVLFPALRRWAIAGFQGTEMERIPTFFLESERPHLMLAAAFISLRD